VKSLLQQIAGLMEQFLLLTRSRTDERILGWV